MCRCDILTLYSSKSLLLKKKDVSRVNSASIVNFQLNVGHWRSYFTDFSSKKIRSSIFTRTLDSMFCICKKLLVNWNMGVPKTFARNGAKYEWIIYKVVLSAIIQHGHRNIKVTITLSFFVNVFSYAPDWLIQYRTRINVYY
jgi:hypothetical protein